MNTKKTKKSDLERIRMIFFQIGLIFSISIAILAFEWKSELNKSNGLGELVGIIDNLELPPITFVEKEVKPPLPKVIITELNIVDDSKNIVDTVTFMSTESNDTTKTLNFLVNNTKEDDVIEVVDYYAVQSKPIFPGGEAGMLKFVAKTTKYPELAKQILIDGTVYVKFIINEKGKVENASIYRGVDMLLDTEAIRVISSMPDWTPGNQAGMPVRVSFIIPIKFKLYK